MKRIAIREFGEPEVLEIEEAGDPHPGPNEVVIRVRAAGVNPYETYQRAGKYGAKNPQLPFTPGRDAAGTIEEVGAGVDDLKAGDRVYTYGTLTGAYAELALCRRDQVYKLPDAASFGQGAAIFVPYVTAYRALFQLARAKPPDIVLVHGASGGTGSAAVQLAHAAGVRVIGTAGTPEGLDLVKQNGADVALNHRDGGYLESVGRVDVILEMLANVNLERDLEIIAEWGRIVVIGSRGSVEITPRYLMLKGVMLTGMLLWETPPAEFEEAKKGVHERFMRGDIRPVVGREIPLADAPEAHRLVMEPGAYGKIVLVP